MKKINTWLLASLLTVGFSGASFASAEGEAKDDGHGDGHGDGHVMEEGHKMSAVGMPAEKGAVANKTITVHMMDTMRFNFSNLKIEEGDIVKFVVMNKGKIPHEFGIGSIEEQVAHRDMMKKMPGMGQLPTGAMSQVNDKSLGKIIAIINSMTPKERHFPKLISGSTTRV